MAKIILRQDVENLGKSGDVLTVRDGYARNLLIPRGLAYEATDANLERIKHQKKQAEVKLQKEKKEAESLANKLSQISCTIVMNATGEDKLFGAVTNADIAKVLQEEHNFKIDKKNIELSEPIKELGVFHVPIKIHPEVTQNLKVWVVKK